VFQCQLLVLWLCVFSALLSTTSTQFRRHYFGTMKVNSMQLSLSVLTSSSLPSDLKAVKQSLRFPLIRFEDAKVELGKASFRNFSCFNVFCLQYLLTSKNVACKICSGSILCFHCPVFRNLLLVMYCGVLLTCGAVHALLWYMLLMMVKICRHTLSKVFCFVNCNLSVLIIIK